MLDCILFMFQLPSRETCDGSQQLMDLPQSCPARPQVADRGDPLVGGLSGYTENLIVDHCGGCVWRNARLHALLDKSRPTCRCRSQISRPLAISFVLQWPSKLCFTQLPFPYPLFLFNIEVLIKLVLVLNMHEIFAAGR